MASVEMVPKLAVAVLITSACLAQNTLQLSSATAPAATPVTLSLSLSSSPTPQASALQWTFNYPSNLVTSVQVNAGPALTAANKTMGCNVQASSAVCIAYGLNTTSIGNGVVATITLTASATAAIDVTGTNASTGDGTSLPITGSGGTVRYRFPRQSYQV